MPKIYSVRQTKTPSTPNKTPSTPNKTQSTPTKIPSTPNKTPSAQFQSKEYAKKQILIYAVLSRCNFCRKFTHFFGVPFTGLKIWWRTKNDKYEVWL